jgi:hypothetical protein
MTTDTTMVERCARAILASHDWTTNDGAEGGWDSLSDDWKEVYRKGARAVLECLRTPTPEMVEALMQRLRFEGGGTVADEAAASFAAAIDRALSPSKGEGASVTYPPELLPVADDEAEVIVVDPDTRKETVVWPAPSKGEGE